nr:hypothetical protein HK105_006530 [Polyrhizophydium stewartii]
MDEDLAVAPPTEPVSSALFDRFVAGTLTAAELSSSLAGIHDFYETWERRELRTALWARVFETEWQGDLAWLFRHAGGEEPVEATAFWRIRSREMWERARASCTGRSFSQGLMHAAVRCAFVDVLSGLTADKLSQHAVEAGSLPMLRHAVERGGAALKCDHVWVAASAGRLDMVQWLSPRVPRAEWSFVVMDKAAESGNVALLDWLHRNRIEGCSPNAMTGAIIAGKADSVRWLLANIRNVEWDVSLVEPRPNWHTDRRCAQILVDFCNENGISLRTGGGYSLKFRPHYFPFSL